MWGSSLITIGWILLAFFILRLSGIIKYSDNKETIKKRPIEKYNTLIKELMILVANAQLTEVTEHVFEIDGKCVSIVIRVQGAFLRIETHLKSPIYKQHFFVQTCLSQIGLEEQEDIANSIGLEFMKYEA